MAAHLRRKGDNCKRSSLLSFLLTLARFSRPSVLALIPWLAAGSAQGEWSDGIAEARDHAVAAEGDHGVE
jgi:hypothetical protein